MACTHDDRPNPILASCWMDAPAYPAGPLEQLLSEALLWRTCRACGIDASTAMPLWVQYILGCVGSNWLTDLHSGHSKLVIFSHCDFVNSIHFGWYLQQAERRHDAQESPDIPVVQGTYMTSKHPPSRQAVEGQIVSPLLAFGAHNHEGVRVVRQLTDTVAAL